MALHQKGDYWYGDGPDDVWEYFLMLKRNSLEPVKHWRQAVCPCGGVAFRVDYDVDEHWLQRFCTTCDESVVMFENEFESLKGRPPPPNAPMLMCVCGGDEFEVVGVTAPFMGEERSAKWFYLGLRCVDCGCLGEYASWLPRYKDAAAFLAML